MRVYYRMPEFHPSLPGQLLFPTSHDVPSTREEVVRTVYAAERFISLQPHLFSLMGETISLLEKAGSNEDRAMVYYMKTHLRFVREAKKQHGESADIFSFGFIAQTAEGGDSKLDI
ncbi:MAG: hypothetical protein G01um101448_1150, partial [Parcubacteria group bacterium Gr01-1014_48]